MLFGPQKDEFIFYYNSILLKEFGSAGDYTKFSAAEKEGSIRYGDLKQVLAESIATYFAEFRKKRAALLQDSATVTAIMERGAKKAGDVAKETMSVVRKMVGVR